MYTLCKKLKSRVGVVSDRAGPFVLELSVYFATYGLNKNINQNV